MNNVMAGPTAQLITRIKMPASETPLELSTRSQAFGSQSESNRPVLEPWR